MIDTVKTQSGYISGIPAGQPGRPVQVFRGVPYAAPPVGDLRWQPPQPVSPWTGVRQCAQYCAWAPQSLTPLPGDPEFDRPEYRVPARVTESEDCLYLNILTPAESPQDKLPVMVWMHSKGYRLGSANEPLYNIGRLPQYGVVQVNVNMRLGPFGFFAHPLLSRESPQAVSGNYMFLDMIAALKWVQNNIAAFGGDPSNVTIFGESGGAGKVITLLTSPLAGGLFQRAIAQSGVADNAAPLKEQEKMGEIFFKRLGVSSESDPLRAARALPWQKINEVEKALVDEMKAFGPAGVWDIAVDGWLLPARPIDIYQSGRQSDVPLLLTANLGELSTDEGSFLLPAYLKILDASAKTKAKMYVGIFDQVPAQWRREGCFCNHAMELPYVFGDWDDSSGFWKSIMRLAAPAGAKSAKPGLTEVDQKVADNMMRLWTQYAKTGDPGIPGLLNWPVWDQSNDQYLLITDSLKVRPKFSQLVQK
jgi:para-nitrobenzyl esterase